MPASFGSITSNWDAVAQCRADFCDLVRTQGKKQYRDLPWRNIDDPYAVLVSEVMLQQTQVSRVKRYWTRFCEMFPTIDALSAASTSDVLEAWQGLGYNRRALALKRTADICSHKHYGALPKTADDLVELPGIGPATAAGVMAFAYNKPAVYLETNVRTVFLHCLFPACEKVSDKQIRPYVADTCPSHNVRAWYYALLDFGAHLKATLPNPSRRSAHHTRQSTFEGSRRQKRSFILKTVLDTPEGVEEEDILLALNIFEHSCGRPSVDQAVFNSILEELEAEGFFHHDSTRVRA